MLGNPVYQSDPDYRYQNGDFVCNVQVVFPPAVIAIHVVQAHSTIQEDLVVTAETSNMNSALVSTRWDGFCVGLQPDAAS